MVQTAGGDWCTAAAGIADTDDYYGFQVLFSDYDQDGWPDLFVANDSTPNLLYHNQGNGSFREVALEAGVAYNYEGEGQSGMGAAFGDYDGDGRADVFLTNYAHETHSPYRTPPRGRPPTYIPIHTLRIWLPLCLPLAAPNGFRQLSGTRLRLAVSRSNQWDRSVDYEVCSPA